jgi:hypothetical protein
MSFDGDERSAEQNRPIDLYRITTPTASYLHTSHTVDVPFGGNVYTALTMDRGPNRLADDAGVDELTITLPISHPLVQGYASTGIPELVVTVTVLRLQSVSGAAQQIFTGAAQAMTVDLHTATFRVPATTADALRIQLPVIGATRTCNHRLFDDRCSPIPGGVFPLIFGPPGSGGPSRVLFTITDTIASISSDGLSVTMPPGTPGGLNTKPGGWAAFGRIILASGDQRRILTQTGTTVTLAVPFPGLGSGAAVTIEAGCLHNIATCISKFNNQFNFGGHPLMSSFSPWAANGLGIIQQV